MKKTEKTAEKRSTWSQRILFVVLLVLVFVSAPALGLVSAAFAVPDYLNSTAAGSQGFNPYYGTSYTCKLCHSTDGGSPSSPRNSFGIAWTNASLGNHKLPPITSALANEDTDGDTFSNSAEIAAGTYPADASSRPADTTRPSVTINQAAGQADPTSASPINFTVVFSETVTGFATGDVTISGTAGATTATVSGSGTTYNVAVSGMTSAGTVVVSIAANVAQDAAGNLNTASTSTDNTVNYTPPSVLDTTPPTITAFTVPSTATSLTVSSTISATDTVGVTALMCTESTKKPDINHPDWKAPTSPGTYSGTHTFSTPGAKTLRAWAKDAAGNISASKTARVTITLPPPPEPDMTLWVGTWFKVKITGQEYPALNPGVDDSEEETPAYLKISSWDPNNQTLQSSLYQYDPSRGQWVSDPLDLHCVPGKVLDFRTWTQVVGDITYGFAAQIKGTVRAGVLRTATFVSLGGYYARMRNVENEGEEDVAGWLKINGTLIPESKVPREIL